MKNKILGNLPLSLIACAVLAGCGSDDKDELPTVSVAAAVSLKESRTTTIAATADDDDDTISYSWTQVSGPTLSLTNTTTATVGVTAPAVSANAAAVLRVTVTDEGNQTASADVTINIANNLVPTATAAFEPAAEKSDVTLTATAADADGEVETYSWIQTSGTPVTLTGADTATLSFTAPSVTEDTELGFSLTVTDDDDEAATITGVVTVTPVMTTFTVSGTVSEAAFANATVTGTLAGQTFTATADANGAFSLPLQADDDETNLFADIRASSVTTAGLEYYKFVPSLTADVTEAAAGSFTTKLSSAIAGLFNVQPLAEGDSPNTISINAVSTALYSLIVAANGGTAPTNLDSFTLVEKSVSPDELIEAAAVVKLVTQGGVFALPEGVTNVLELLTNTEAYNNYVAAAEAEDPNIITDTIDEIIADPELTPPVDESSLASTYFEVYPAADGFLSRGGNRYDFNEDGTGAEVFSAGVHDFDWSLVDGKVEITYAGTTSSTYFPTVTVGLFGLTQEQVNQLNQAGYFQVEAKQTPLTASLTRIIQGEKTDTYRVVSTGTRAMVPVTLPGGVVINPEPVSYEVTEDQLLRNADKLADLKFTAAELDGEWVFEHYYYAGDEGFGYANMFADIFDMSADGTGVALENDKPFSWALDETGLLTFSFEDGSYTEIIKLDQVGTDVQVFSASYDTEGNLVAADADYALKLDGSDFKDFDQTNPEDMYWNTTINTWTKDSWDGDTLLWDNGFAYFGWQLLEDGTGYQMGSFEMSPPDFEPVFNTPLGWTKDPISEDESIVSINRWMCADDNTKPCAQRQWRLLKSTDGILGPRIYVFEVEDRRINSTSPWFIASGLGPRINIYEEISFDYWNETAVTEEAAISGLVKGMSFTSTKKPVARTLVEPNQKPEQGI
ncbi:hypothetical protein EIK76_03440 [Rheinheimera mesophila]|uniref:Ig-like domain-containing protein n=1 Tax=Rheinheimera mesophila TaxID=1547515 RepID=A0A3P3QPH1_9GAMM|nr:hypothetical protein [Rheinheimera mesophila]KKL01174.1 hypothetical protein SD53_11465 [Rheinheimera mesophila]RRJ23152.1 hypothetical protein EIK76_03440 [Rheinheimera mesophila]